MSLSDPRDTKLFGDVLEAGFRHDFLHHVLCLGTELLRIVDAAFDTSVFEDELDVVKAREEDLYKVVEVGFVVW